jgi:hypothetical protein
LHPERFPYANRKQAAVFGGSERLKDKLKPKLLYPLTLASGAGGLSEGAPGPGERNVPPIVLPMRNKHYKKQNGIRCSDEEWQRFMENRRKSKLSWNLFIKRLNDECEKPETGR